MAGTRTARIRNAVSVVDRFVSRHSASTALAVAYASFAYRVFQEVSQVAPAPLMERSGVELLDPEVTTPLTRSGVLAQVRSGGNAAKGKMRSQTKDLSSDNLDEEDEMDKLLQRALQLAAGNEDPEVRGKLIPTIYTSLGHMYSARGQYLQVLHAMDLSIRASADAGDDDAVANGHVNFAGLEMKHHRYYAAQTRFEDAKTTQVDRDSAMEVSISCGMGWAALMQDSWEKAEGHFQEALHGLGFNHLPRVTGMCQSHEDGLDKERAVALSGLGLVLMRRTSKLSSQADVLIDCAAKLFQTGQRSEGGWSHEQNSQYEQGWPRATGAIGLAHFAAGRAEVSQRYYRKLEGRGDATADLALHSHSALYLGLAEYHKGNVALSKEHVDELISAAGSAREEAVEWLVRFAKAHRWVPAGSDFGVLLFQSASSLLRDIGDANRLAKHLVAFGRFLYGLGDQHLRHAVGQLQTSLDLLDQAQLRWPVSEVAAIHSLMGVIYHQLNEPTESVRSFEFALALDKLAVNPENGRSLEILMMSFTNLGAAKLQVPAITQPLWRSAMGDLKQGLAVAQRVGLHGDDPRRESIQRSIQNAQRIGHYKGLAETCPSAFVQLAYRPISTVDDRCHGN